MFFLSSQPLSPQRQWWHRPFRHYIWKFKNFFGMGLAALFFTNACNILVPYIIGRVIDLLNARNMGEIHKYLFLLFGLSIGTAVFRYFWRIYFGRFHYSVAADLRHKIFRKMLHLGQNYHQKSETGEKMTLLTEDVENFRMGVGPGLLILADALIYIFTIVPLMLVINTSWTLKCLVFTLVLPFVLYKLERRFDRGYRKLQDQTGVLTGFAQETISGIKVIKSLSLQNLRSLHFRHINKKLKDYGLQVDYLESLFTPFFEISIMLGAVILMFTGAQDVVSGQMTLGTFFTFYQYLFRMVWPMMAFGLSFMLYKKAKASLGRIEEVFDQENWIHEGNKKSKKGKSLKVSSLVFQYPDSSTPTLKGISFELQEFQSMALVGPVGSGKSTLAQILSRQIPMTQGQITYDHQNIYDYRKSDYSSIISLVPQDVFLFKKSILDNLSDFLESDFSHAKYGLDHFSKVNDFSSSQYSLIIENLKKAHIYKEVQDLKEGLNTLLEENGQGLSGGQRQRLTLIRGLLVQPQWLILDDSLSAVDIQTEHKIIENLRQLKAAQKMNFIFCSHRIQSLNWVDQILVLDKGEQVGLGSHEELIKHCSVYQKLYQQKEDFYE